VRKGWGKVILGSVLMVAPLFVFIVSAIFYFSQSDSETNQFLVPGSMEVEIEEPGKYYLWHDHVTLFNGTSFSMPKEIPHGVKMEIRGADGEALALKGGLSTSVSSGNHSKVSIGYVEVDKAGWVKVSVSGDFEDRVFSLSKSSFGIFFGAIFGGVVLVGAMGTVGLVLLILGIVELARK